LEWQGSRQLDQIYWSLDKVRHAELAPRQFTQHDGFYLTENAVVMMERKLKARTSIEQYLKYCTLIALEELLYGRKEHWG